MRALPDMFRSHVLRFTVLLASINADAAQGTLQSGDQPVAVSVALDFSRDVFSILQRSCLECHGPKKQEGQLRLDGQQNLEEADVVDPKNPDASELIRRITLPRNHEEIMPATGEPLTGKQVTILRDWIARGAEWPDSFEAPKHWSYQIPEKTELPHVNQSNWSRSPIDAFVLERITAAGLKPSPAAEPALLLRRVYFDLIGLPPTPAEVDVFVQDPSDDMFQQVVDELLQRPQFGEKWARHWLDLARYADSHGFQRDDLRDNWAWRDWVINALNEDMPFDQFTIEQIAGDLLPNATESQKIATGFHRCAATNVEAGSLPEESRAEQLIDRVNTTSTVWLGSTLECVQCHDHKYDPFTTTDYYSLLAFFNNTAIEADRTNPRQPSSIAFQGPSMAISNPDRDRERAALDKKLARLEAALAKRRTELDSDAVAKRLNRQIAVARKAIAKLAPDTTLVMVEQEPRSACIFERGDYRQHGSGVQPGTPVILHPMPDGPPNRLTLARWLVDPANPLVARVTVNRWWAEIFGTGLVATLEDFGIKGESPTHPELLDWLAVDFMQNKWSMKHMLRTIVSSSTYRQSSRISPELVEADDQNRLLARGPHFRFDAEMIRDNALAVSGLLDLTQFGPPIRPPQPDGLWAKVGGQQYNYVVSEGTQKYRRGIYVVLKRSAPNPSLTTFDASARLACTVKRSRSNTPLQALTLLNDPVYVEASRAFAHRVLSESAVSDFRTKLDYAFQLCTSRKPGDRERETLTRLFETQSAAFEQRPDDVSRITSEMPSSVNEKPHTVAAWYSLTTVLLNLHETITKP